MLQTQACRLATIWLPPSPVPDVSFRWSHELPVSDRERERERRLEARDAHGGKRSKLTRDRERDISEKIALGQVRCLLLPAAWPSTTSCQLAQAQHAPLTLPLLLLLPMLRTTSDGSHRSCPDLE